MNHSFVAAKLFPRLPAWATYGQRVLPSLTTTPFLALHLFPTESPHVIRSPNLFVVSSEQPTSPGSEYFILDQANSNTNARTLAVVPPLPFTEPLYLSITPRICATLKDVLAYERLANAEKYQLDRASFKRFLEALKEAGPSIPTTRETVHGLVWDAWSGYPPLRETPGSWIWCREVPFFFDLILLESLPKHLEPRVFNELALLRQLILDYTWEGCEVITQYIESMRETLPRLAVSGRMFRPPLLPACRPDPSADALRLCVAHLQSLPVIHDDNLHDIEGENKLADDWRNEEMDFVGMSLATPVPAVKADDVKVIAFDPNVLIDRDGPLQETLMNIFPTSVHQFTAKELLDLYVERETLRAADGHPASPTATARDVARYLSVSIGEPTIDDALKCHAQPRLYPEASTAIVSFINQGYSLLVLPSPPDYKVLLSQLPGLSLAPVSAPFSWESLRTQIHLILKRSQILVVTSDIYRTAEPASAAGFPTVFIKRVGSRSAELSIPTAPPTYTLTTLTRLLPALKGSASVPEPQEPVVNGTYPPMRIHDCYQVTFLLGSGSFARVFNGIQVHTGSSVAIKFEPKPATLPYEAAFYAQLEGVPGVPRIHWSGTERNAYVIVMDKLGPNLEQLRRVCRGRFGLRTLLMLGEQMLSTIEAVHARGIIVRDIRPENFAMGLMEEYKRLHLLDFGLCKLWLNPSTGTHMPFRKGKVGIGTLRYASSNVHFGLEPSRRDDIEATGLLLLYLLHGRLPWPGICAPDIAELRRIGDMKSGKPLADLLKHEKTPKLFTTFFEHCRSLAFEEQPNYKMLRGLLRIEFEERGWGEYDWEYDWWKGKGEGGTLIPGEYKLDSEFVEPVEYMQNVL